MTVYFISDGEFVKIGYTTADDAEQRLKSLQTGNPKKLKLLKSVPGDSQTERKCHQSLARYRVSGEWFQLCNPVKKFIKSFVGTGQLSANILTQVKVDQSLLRYNHHDIIWIEEAADEAARVQLSRDVFNSAYERILMPSGLKYLCLADNVRDWLSTVDDYNADEQDINELYMPGSGCSAVINALNSVFKVNQDKLKYEPAKKLYATYQKWFQPHYYNDTNWKGHCDYVRKKHGDYYIAQRQDAFWSFVDNVIARAHLEYFPYLRLFESDKVAYFNALFCGGKLRSHFKDYILSISFLEDMRDEMPSNQEMVAGFFYFCSDQGYLCSYAGEGSDPQIAIPR